MLVQLAALTPVVFSHSLGRVTTRHWQDARGTAPLDNILNDDGNENLAIDNRAMPAMPYSLSVLLWKTLQC